MDFDKMNGLVPAIIQDADTAKVLMLGFMNKEAYDKTVETGKVTLDVYKRQIYIDASISNADGIFTLNGQQEKYRLIIQHLLFHTKQVTGNGKNAGTIQLQPQDYALDEVCLLYTSIRWENFIRFWLHRIRWSRRGLINCPKHNLTVF